MHTAHSESYVYPSAASIRNTYHVVAATDACVAADISLTATHTTQFHLCQRIYGAIDHRTSKLNTFSLVANGYPIMPYAAAPSRACVRCVQQSYGRPGIMYICELSLVVVCSPTLWALAKPKWKKKKQNQLFAVRSVGCCSMASLPAHWINDDYIE